MTGLVFLQRAPSGDVLHWRYFTSVEKMLLICDVIVRQESCRTPMLQTGSLVTDTWAPAMVKGVMLTCASDFCVSNSLIAVLSGLSFSWFSVIHVCISAKHSSKAEQVLFKEVVFLG